MPGGGAAVAASGMEGGQKSVLIGVLMASFAAFGGILFGYDTGTISGIIAMPDWLATFGHEDATAADGYSMTTNEKALVVSILSAGTFIGALLGYPFGDFLGRRYGIIAACLIFVLGVGLQLDTMRISFIIGRLIAGFGVGLVSCLVPMYQAETAPAWLRGGIVAAYQWAITIGLLLASIANQQSKSASGHASWRIPIAIQFAWAAILVGGMAFLPESPRYLASKGKKDAARQALARLLALPASSPLVQDELEVIQAAIVQQLTTSKGSSYMDCFRTTEGNRVRFRVLTGIAIQALQQLCGVNFIFYYGTTYFQSAGVGNAFTISIITNVVNVCMTLPGMYLVDRAGRRNLLLFGAAGMLISQLLVAILGTALPHTNRAAQQASIAFVSIFIGLYAMSWGPLAWVVTSEIFPSLIRARAMSLSTASNWLFNWAIGFATPYMVDSGKGNANLGSKVFFIWSAMCGVCILFTWSCIPETRGLTLEQVELLYINSTIRGSSRYGRELVDDAKRREMARRGSDDTAVGTPTDEKDIGLSMGVGKNGGM